MYPQDELKRLAAHKVAIQREIAHRRVEWANLATVAVQPVEWLDRMLIFWRKLSPLVRFAALPLGFFLQRAATRRIKLLGPLLRWGPLAFGAVRALSLAASHRRGSAGVAGVRR